MKIFKADTFVDAYLKSLKDLNNNYDFKSSPRGQEIKESFNVNLQFNPKFSLFESDVRSSKYKYLIAELIWYFSCRNDVELIGKFAKIWNKLAEKNEDLIGSKIVNSNYGTKLLKDKGDTSINNLFWVVYSLLNDKDSRQAIAVITDQSNQYINNPDFACTNTMHFFIRENKLYLFVDMRSNDCIFGTPNDIFFFSLIYFEVLNILKRYYELDIGYLNLKATNYHVYSNHFDTIQKLANTDNYKSIEFPLYNKLNILNFNINAYDNSQSKGISINENFLNKVFKSDYYGYNPEIYKDIDEVNNYESFKNLLKQLMYGNMDNK